MRKDLAMCGQPNVVLPLFLRLKDPSIHCGLSSEDVRTGGGGGGHAVGENHYHFLQTCIIIIYVYQHFPLMLSTKQPYCY